MSDALRALGRQKEAGRKWFRSLTSTDKGEFGDAMVLGTFDWRDWFHDKPSAPFLSAANDERTYWECTS